MKIDLDRELQLDRIAPPAPSRFRSLVALVVVNLLVALAALALALRTPATMQQSATDSASGTDTQALAQVDARLRNVERTMHDLRATVIEYKMSMKELVAKQRIDSRRDSRRSNGGTGAVATAEVQAAAHAASLAAPALSLILTDEEKRAIDALSDQDETGARLREFVRAITNAPRKSACEKYMLEKADAWIASALALPDDNGDFELYADNAMYFYDAVADVSDDNGVVAYTEAKRSQIRFERQRRDMRLAAQQDTGKLQEQIQNLEQRLKEQEEREQKRFGPPPPAEKRVYKP